MGKIEVFKKNKGISTLCMLLLLPFPSSLLFLGDPYLGRKKREGAFPKFCGKEKEVGFFPPPPSSSEVERNPQCLLFIIAAIFFRGDRCTFTWSLFLKEALGTWRIWRKKRSKHFFCGKTRVFLLSWLQRKFCPTSLLLVLRGRYASDKTSAHSSSAEEDENSHSTPSKRASVFFGTVEPWHSEFLQERWILLQWTTWERMH